MRRLENKIALVTGAAQGIGASVAQHFLQEGATVIITDINEDKGAAVVKALGSKAIYRTLDVREESQWQATAQWVQQQYQGLDVLVNNAGVTGFHADLGPQNPEHASLESWQEVHRLNSDGTFLGCKYAIGLMKNRHRDCSIINISSRSGVVGIPHAAAYASSKASVRNHSKSVALYCAEMGYKIRCNSIHPAVILTQMWDSMLGTGEAREKNLKAMSAGIPLGSFGKPEDVALAAVYLASEEAQYLTGIELTIDGGILAGATASPAK